MPARRHFEGNVASSRTRQADGFFAALFGSLYNGACVKPASEIRAPSSFAQSASPGAEFERGIILEHAGTVVAMNSSGTRSVMHLAKDIGRGVPRMKTGVSRVWRVRGFLVRGDAMRSLRFWRAGCSGFTRHEFAPAPAWPIGAKPIDTFRWWRVDAAAPKGVCNPDLLATRRIMRR